MNLRTNVEILVSEIKPLLLEAIDRTARTKRLGFLWRKGALKTLDRIFDHFTIDVDYLVKYLTVTQKKNIRRNINIASIEHRALLMTALYKTIFARIQDGSISTTVVVKIIKDRCGSDFFDRINDSKHIYLEKYDRTPPAFVLLSPTKFCNLHCVGCYASSSVATTNSMPYSMVRRIILESHELWGARSVAISGGEPLLYESEGKTLFDLAEEFPFMYFKVYTNGVQINDETAKRMAKLANISPAISLEGNEDQTDARRGKGVFKKVIKAIERLRKLGVPVGVSITATRDNLNTLLDPSFYDYLFDDLKITYGWIFEYMPIGRGISTDLMPTPEERKKLFGVLDEQNRRHRFICDFWSTSPSAEGCIAAGRSFGYVYINWDGAVVPCVFNPYSDTNIRDIYSDGGSLNDAINKSPLLKEIRHWQDSYGFQKGNKAGNYMTPCPIRDHHKQYRAILDTTQARPIDSEAAIALVDPDYYDRMVKYGELLKDELDPLWKRRFIDKHE